MGCELGLGYALVWLASWSLGADPEINLGDYEVTTDASRLVILQQDVVDRGRELFAGKFQASDGVGPYMNATSCSACHHQRALGGAGPSFANHRIGFDPKTGETFILLDSLLYPGPDMGWEVGVRNPPWLHGIAFKDALNASGIRANEDPLDLDGNGISGRFVARHGWKGRIPDARSFVAEALRSELGLTTSLYPFDPYNPGGNPQEMSDDDLTALTAFVYSLLPPGRDEGDIYTPATIAGLDLFRGIGCTSCHVESLQITETFQFPADDPVIRIDATPTDPVDVFLFSDLLLHNMGPTLGDIPQGDASRGEFRTRDLWGMYLTLNLLHDARTRLTNTAIEDHWDPLVDPVRQSEAAGVIELYRALTPEDQGQLIFFLNTLQIPLEG